MNDHVHCAACGSDWTIVRTALRWRTRDAIDCPDCGRHLLKAQRHAVIRLLVSSRGLVENSVG